MLIFQVWLGQVEELLNERLVAPIVWWKVTVSNVVSWPWWSQLIVPNRQKATEAYYCPELFHTSDNWRQQCLPFYPTKSIADGRQCQWEWKYFNFLFRSSIPGQGLCSLLFLFKTQLHSILVMLKSINKVSVRSVKKSSTSIVHEDDFLPLLYPVYPIPIFRRSSLHLITTCQ